MAWLICIIVILLVGAGIGNHITNQPTTRIGEAFIKQIISWVVVAIAAMIAAGIAIGHFI